MLPSRTRRHVTTSSNPRNASGMLMPAILDAVQDRLAPRLAPTKRARVVAQGATTKTVTVSGVGESVADGANVPVLTAYTSTVVGAAGGPAVNDDLLIWFTSPGNPVILGKINY